MQQGGFPATPSCAFSFRKTEAVLLWLAKLKEELESTGTCRGELRDFQIFSRQPFEIKRFGQEYICKNLDRVGVS
jgi:hypothetical protein